MESNFLKMFLPLNPEAFIALNLKFSKVASSSSGEFLLPIQ